MDVKTEPLTVRRVKRTHWHITPLQNHRTNLTSNEWLHAATWVACGVALMALLAFGALVALNYVTIQWNAQ